MRWESKREERINKKRKWHDFFCLLPRRICQDYGPILWVWLETVERKGEIQFDCYDNDYWLYSYRLKKQK